MLIMIILYLSLIMLSTSAKYVILLGREIQQLTATQLLAQAYGCVHTVHIKVRQGGIYHVRSQVAPLTWWACACPLKALVIIT